MTAIEKTMTGFSIDADINFTNIVSLRDEGIKLISKGTCEIDLSHLKNSNAVSLALLLAWLRAANERHSKITFLNASDSLRNISIAFGLKNIIELQR